MQPGSVKRADDPIGTPIKTFRTPEEEQVQAVASVDELGVQSGVAANPTHVQGAALTDILNALVALLQAQQDTIQNLDDAMNQVNRKLPLGLSITPQGNFKAALDTNTYIYANPSAYNLATAHTAVAYELIQLSSMRWIAQRSLITG